MNNGFYDRRLWLFFWISEPFLDMSICHAHSYQYILTCTGLSLNFSILKTNSFTTYFNWPKVYSVIFYTMEQNFLHKVDFNIVHYNGFAKSWTTINLYFVTLQVPVRWPSFTPFPPLALRMRWPEHAHRGNSKTVDVTDRSEDHHLKDLK